MSWIRNAVVIAGNCPAFAAVQSIVHRFLAWAQRVGADERAYGASALARAFLHSDLPPSVKAECGVAMTALIEDPSADVRRALAEALAGSNDAPRHLVVALANDQSDVAAPLLERSRLLPDAELGQCVAVGDAVAQCAVARRPGLGTGPAEALAECGKHEAMLALLGNLDADLTAGILQRIFERFGDQADARSALLARPDLPASLHAEIVFATAKAVSDFSIATEWLDKGRVERIARDACDAVVIAISAGCEGDERAELARTLRERGVLTMALLLRSLLGGAHEFVAAALAELSGVRRSRAAGFLREPHGQGFAAMALKAGLPVHALIAFRGALSAINVHGAGRCEGLKPRLVKAAIAACTARGDPALEPILSLMWRFAAEAAKVEARGSTSGTARLDFSPAANDQGGTPTPVPPIEAQPGHSTSLLLAAPYASLLPEPIPVVEAA